MVVIGPEYKTLHGTTRHSEVPQDTARTLRKPSMILVGTFSREFVLTHVILAPGACGRGVRAAVDDTASAGSAGSGDEFQIVNFPSVFTAEVNRVTLRCNVFLLFMDLSSKTPSFESFFGRLPARNALKSRCFS